MEAVLSQSFEINLLGWRFGLFAPCGAHRGAVAYRTASAGGRRLRYRKIRGLTRAGRSGQSSEGAGVLSGVIRTVRTRRLSASSTVMVKRRTRKTSPT